MILFVPTKHLISALGLVCHVHESDGFSWEAVQCGSRGKVCFVIFIRNDSIFEVATFWPDVFVNACI